MPISRPYINQSPYIMYIFHGSTTSTEVCNIRSSYYMHPSRYLQISVGMSVPCFACPSTSTMSKDSNIFEHHISVLYYIIKIYYKYIYNTIDYIYNYISYMCQHSESWKQDETSRNFKPREAHNADICWSCLVSTSQFWELPHFEPSPV